MEIKRTVLKYKDKFSSEPYVALDQNSGGYPYAVSAMKAHDFGTVENAERYDRTGKFEVVELFIHISERPVK